MHVFERLADAAFRRKVAGNHFRPFGIHHLRSSCGDSRHLQKSLGVETKPRRKDQALGKREAVETENEIDGELGAATVTDLADVKAVLKQRIEYGCGDLCRFYIDADQSDAVALPHLRARARNRNFEKAYGRATRAPSAAMRSGSQVEVQITILPGVAGRSAR